VALVVLHPHAVPFALAESRGGDANFRRMWPLAGQYSANPRNNGHRASPAGGILAHRTRVAATKKEPDMSDTLPARTRSPRVLPGTLVAVALFLIVYLGVLGVVFAPKDLIGVTTATAVAQGD
jgi:hypothetical protein